MDLQELVPLEQLLKTFPRDLEVWLKEQKPSCTAKVAEMADDYKVARGSKGVANHLESATTGRYQFQVAGASSSTSSLKTTQKPGHLQGRAPVSQAQPSSPREVEQITEGRYSVTGVRNGDISQPCTHRHNYIQG